MLTQASLIIRLHPADDVVIARQQLVGGTKLIDEKVTVEAWLLGTDLAATPLYAVTLEGAGATVEDNGILVFDRQTEELAWWSARVREAAPLLP